MNIADIDFSQNTPEVNDALIKLQALSNVYGLPDNISSKIIDRLNDTTQPNNKATNSIQDLEIKLAYPFCEQYIQEIIKLREEKIPNTSHCFKQIARAINRRKSGYSVFQIKNNKSFTEEKAKEIKNIAQKGSSEIYIEIASTNELDKNTIDLLQDCQNIKFCYLGKHQYQSHNLDETLSPKELSQCLTKISNIEKGINPKWSDTAKALYVFRKLYQTCEYGSSSSMSSVFLENNSICQGFAIAYNDLMERQGIDCRICMSLEDGHLFNEIKLNTKWIPVDVSDATVLYKNSHLSANVVEDCNFGGKRFISYLPEKIQHHHKSNGRYMESGSNDISYLTPEEYSSALAEIVPKGNKENIVYGKLLKTKENN